MLYLSSEGVINNSHNLIVQLTRAYHSILTDKFVTQFQFVFCDTESTQLGSSTQEMEIDADNLDRRNYEKIKGKFAGLLTDVCEKLQKRDVNVDGFRLFVISLFSPGDCIPKSSDLPQIFEVITRNGLWNYSHYSPLEQIVEKFAADDEDMKTLIKSYKNDLAGFKASTKILKYIEVVESESSLDDSDSEEPKQAKYDRRYYRKLSIKLHERITDRSLMYIESLWESFADCFLPPITAMFDCVHKGCIVVVWRIPSALVPQIHQQAPQAINFFKEHQIIYVKLGDTIIYEEESSSLSEKIKVQMVSCVGAAKHSCLWIINTCYSVTMHLS